MDEQPEDRTDRRWWKRGLWGAACLVAAAGITLWATGSSASAASGYRTAEATTATVEQTLSVSGTIEPVHQATTEFQVAGTVSAVDARVGQKVSAGQTLASLDTTSLTQAVSSAQLGVSAAEATLSENEAGESAGSSSSASSGGESSAGETSAGGATSTASLTADVTPTSGATDQSTAISGDEQAVVAAQKAEDADAATAAADFAQAQTACSSESGDGTPTSETQSTTTTTPSTTTTTPPSTTTTTTPSGSSTACATALSRSLADQEQVTTDQKAVATAESELAQALSSAAAGGTGSAGGATSGSGASTGGTSGTSTKSGSSSAASSATSGSSTQSTDTAEELASDQAAIDTAQATLIEAQESLADAQLTAPIAGTVASLSITEGQSVSAGSSTDTITIINSGSYETASSLTSTQASQIKVGDTALVSVDGMSGTLAGTVARVGPVDTSSSGDTYPLVVALAAGSHGIATGSTAQVQVVLHRVVGKLSIPTSAVHVTGTNSAYVDVVDSGHLVRKRVTIGAIGGSSTQVTSGITAGTSVVLADLSEAVPSSSTSASTSGFGGSRFSGGGFAGAGGGPGGSGFGG